MTKSLIARHIQTKPVISFKSHVRFVFREDRLRCGVGYAINIFNDSNQRLLYNSTFAYMHTPFFQGILCGFFYVHTFLQGDLMEKLAQCHSVYNFIASLFIYTGYESSNYVCTTCSEHFTRKYSAKRHNITVHHGNGGEIVPLVEYLVRFWQISGQRPVLV